MMNVEQIKIINQVFNLNVEPYAIYGGKVHSVKVQYPKEEIVYPDDSFFYQSLEEYILKHPNG